MKPDNSQVVTARTVREREERLAREARALRENLLKRKRQQRSRPAAEEQATDGER